MIESCLVAFLTSLALQDHPCLFGGRAEDCEESVEVTEGKGQACLQELNMGQVCYIRVNLTLSLSINVI